MTDKNKKKNTRSRRGGTKVKVKVKTGSSEKKPSLVQQLLTGLAGGAVPFLASRIMGPGYSGAINPVIASRVNDRKSRMPTVNTKVEGS
jgi:hypothetical protein|tara:strand:+ start:156 stop:422 length:267 start_codon:yes stop_codon:yes gene_type:complete